MPKAEKNKQPLENKRISAIKVSQWLKGWDKINFDEKFHRRKPEPHFYLFTLSAVELRTLCGIERRQASVDTPRAADLGIQRQHEQERSVEIGRFVEFGYPWSTLSKAKRESEAFDDLRKPGWLPTSIVINILPPNDKRRSNSVAAEDVVLINENESGCSLTLPYPKGSKDWHPSSLPPFEVIDGQHRLWAFENKSDASFELPVVAYYGLDVSWQAYLFWTINIKPKRINPSLAFDLYPLLRAQNWLEQAEGHAVYRETRSQELTEVLWSHQDSPWFDRINMLGEKKSHWVTQSAWIKTLVATFIKPWHGHGSKMGGLFGSRLKDSDEVLGWSRAQQAAFLIFAWKSLKNHIEKSEDAWAVERRAEERKTTKTSQNVDDPAFYSQCSLIATDQGVRGFMLVLNDLCYAKAARLNLQSWNLEGNAPASDEKAVALAVKSIAKQPVAAFVNSINKELESFDWRTSAAPEISEESRRQKLAFRGSGGYKELRIQLLEHLEKSDKDIGAVAKNVRRAVG